MNDRAVPGGVQGSNPERLVAAARQFTMVAARFEPSNFPLLAAAASNGSLVATPDELTRLIGDLSAIKKQLLRNADHLTQVAAKQLGTSGGIQHGNGAAGPSQRSLSATSTAGPASEKLTKLRAQLDQLRKKGAPPREYREKLQDYLFLTATERAGIDSSRWDPAAGVAANRETIKRVYTYYGRLYLDHPELEWAGMANAIGATFAGGIFDLGEIRKVARGLEGIPGLPVPMSPVASMTDQEIRFFETSLLSMQKEIFLDQAVMHEAYLGRGLTAVRELYDAGLIDDRTQQAWAKIDEGARTGNRGLVHEGNRDLLYREQHDIIDDDYRRMYLHGDTGKAVTYLFTALGEPSIPGAKTFAQVSPLAVPLQPFVPVGPVPVPVPGTVTVTTPLPAGNVADFDFRWHHMERDTLPVYTRLLDHHPNTVRALVSSPIDQRIEQYRIHESAGRLLQRLADWKVEFKWWWQR